MEQIAALLKEHVDNHPGLETVDAVKFLYQSYLGPGHLVPSEAASLARLEEELVQCGPDFGEPLTQPLGNGLCRLNLRTSQKAGLSPVTLNRLFFLTAQQVQGDRVAFEGALNQVWDLKLPGSERFLADYHRQGCPAVSHSGTYRERYRPAYRVVLARFGALVPILAAIDREMARREHVRLAIDGPCASGKSTLAKTLADIYRCPVVHMDDFFLQPHQRTPERLAQPGATWTMSALTPRSSPPCTGTKPPAIAPGGAAPATWGRRSPSAPPRLWYSRAAIPSAPTCGSAITCASGPRPPGRPGWSASPSAAPAAPPASSRSGYPWRTATSPPVR